MSESPRSPHDAPRTSSDGLGMLRQDGGINVLHLQGSDEQMARQHGELLAREIRHGMLPFAARFLELQVADGERLLDRAVARVARGLFNRLARRIAANVPRSYRDSYLALAAAAELPADQIKIAIGAIDAPLVALSAVERLARWRVGLPRAPCCSGVVALPEATRDGHVLHGRNLDYDGIGYMDRFPTVAFCRPRSGQRYAWIASAGMHTGALTALNEAGLFLGSNTAPTHDVSHRGLPFLYVHDRVIREATSIGAAIDIVGGCRSASGYNLVLSHGPACDAVVIEHSYRRHRVRHPVRGLLVATNHYVDPEMARTIPPHTLVDFRNTAARYERLGDLLQQRRGQLTVDAVIDCLRDVCEPKTDLVRPLGDVVCNYLNLSSVAADVTARRFYVAADPAPVAQGRFIEFQLDRELDAFGKARAYPLQTVPRSSVLGAAHLEAVRAYQEAHVLLHHRHDPAGAFDALGRAHEALPDEPRLLLALAHLALVLDRRAEAQQAAARYLESGDDHRGYRAHLVLGWCADLRGERAEALACYTRAEERAGADGEAALELAVWRRRPFDERARRALHLELFNIKRVIA